MCKRAVSLLLTLCLLLTLTPSAPAGAASAGTVNVEIYYGHSQTGSHDIDDSYSKKLKEIFEQTIGTYNGKTISAVLHTASDFSGLSSLSPAATKLVVILYPDKDLTSYTAKLNTYMQSGGCVWLCGENEDNFATNNAYMKALAQKLAVSFSLGTSSTDTKDQLLADLAVDTPIGRKNQFGAQSKIALGAANNIEYSDNRFTPVVTYQGKTYMIDAPVTNGWLTVSADIDMVVSLIPTKPELCCPQILYNMLDRSAAGIEAQTSRHTHSWTFNPVNSETNTIRGYCENSGCDFSGSDNAVELRLVAETRAYNGAAYEDLYYVQGPLAVAARVSAQYTGAVYYSRDESNARTQLDGPPTDAGKYSVKVSLRSGSGTALSAVADFEITRKSLTVTNSSYNAPNYDVGPPTPRSSLTYDGESQMLLSYDGKHPEGTTMLYSLDVDGGEDTWHKGYGSPMATEVGLYYIYWKLDGGKNYQDIPADASHRVYTSIAKGELTSDVFREVTPPQAKTLPYTGQPQELIVPGSVPEQYGKLEYWVLAGNTYPPDAPYKEDIPTATAVGNYFVYYRVSGGDNYTPIMSWDRVKSQITAPTGPHVHTWSPTWSTDATHHWHDCAAANCDVTANSQKDGYGAHQWDEGEITTEPTVDAPGVKTFTCTVCGAAKTEALEKLPSFTVTGRVLDAEGQPLAGADVFLRQGWQTNYTAKTDAQGQYSFGRVVPDIYNLVAEKDGVTMTKLVTVATEDVAVDTLQMPAGKINSVLQVTGEHTETLKVVVGGLDQEAQQHSAPNTEVRVQLDVAETTAPPAQLKAALPEQATVLYLNFDLSRSVTAADGNTDSGNLAETASGSLEIVIPYTFTEGREVLVYRAHGQEVHRFTKLDAAPSADFEDASFYPDREGASCGCTPGNSPPWPWRRWTRRSQGTRRTRGIPPAWGVISPPTTESPCPEA